MSGRCSAMFGAIGWSLEDLFKVAFSSVNNLHPIAIQCDSAEVSTGLRFRSVGCWFITWHTLGARWCISKKCRKRIIEIHMRSLESWFETGMLGFATCSGESFIFRSYWFIFWQILVQGQWWVSLAVYFSLPLFWIQLLTKKAFRELESWGCSWNIWPINPTPFELIPLRPRVFSARQTWRITV